MAIHIGNTSYTKPPTLPALTEAFKALVDAAQKQANIEDRKRLMDVAFKASDAMAKALVNETKPTQ